MRSPSPSIAALAALAAPAHRAAIESRIAPRSARPAASQRPISAATGRSSSTSRATARVPRRRDSNRADSRWISSPTSLRSSSFSPISPSKRSSSAIFSAIRRSISAACARFSSTCSVTAPNLARVSTLCRSRPSSSRLAVTALCFALSLAPSRVSISDLSALVVPTCTLYASRLL